MRKLLFTSTAAIVVLAAVSTALAADLGAPMYTKAPPLPPAPVYLWTGWYLGANVGYGWGNVRTDDAGSATSTTVPLNAPAFNNPSVSFADSVTQHDHGVIGGGQFGYNYQINPQWVVGFETDIQGSAKRGSDTATAPFSGTVCLTATCGVSAPLNGVVTATSEVKIDWFGTVRGRVGYLLNDGLLLYGTGGLAYGRVNVSGNVNVSGAFPFGPSAFVFGPTTSAFGQSKTNIGFAVGAGLEGRFTAWLPSNWTWKLEYLYVDLGSIDTSTSFAAASNEPEVFTPLTGTKTIHTHFTDNIVRVGVNYQFH